MSSLTVALIAFACMGMSSEERPFRDLVRKAVIVGQIGDWPQGFSGCDDLLGQNPIRATLSL